MKNESGALGGPEDLDGPESDNSPAGAADEEATVSADDVTDEAPGGEDTRDETIADLERRLEEATDQMLRARADFENFRKRADRERSEQRRQVLSEALLEFLHVVDHLELALESEGGFEDLRKGVELIHSQSQKLLTRFDVEPVPAEGELFDPAVHDALARFEDPEVDQPMVAGVLQRGYRIGERLLRPSRVRVAVPAESSGQEERRD